MARILILLAVGTLAGLGAGYYFAQEESPRGIQSRQTITTIPTLSAAAALAHRDSGYQDLHTVAQIVALPTDLARAEALFALAARSESDTVQRLILDAHRLEDAFQRAEFLRILFSRLAELDPQSALAQARSDPFTFSPSVEEIVWRTWSRYDLDAALTGAKQYTRKAERAMAARGMFSAYGEWGNAYTARIASELGVQPDWATLARHLYHLIARSPAEAINHLNSLPPGRERSSYLRAMAGIFAERGIDERDYASLFANADIAQKFSDAIRYKLGQIDPQAAAENMLDVSKSPAKMREFQALIGMLAYRDLDAALAVFDSADKLADRQAMATAIGPYYARQHPEAAVAWSRTLAAQSINGLEMLVLRTIVQTDPQMAFAEVSGIPDSATRARTLQVLITDMVETSPAQIPQYITLIEDPDARASAIGKLAVIWSSRDPKTALQWLDTLDHELAPALFTDSLQRLIGSDVDAAIAMLPRASQENQAALRSRITSELAEKRSPAAAEAFMRRFEGQPGYEKLQSSLVRTLASSDSDYARAIAEQIADERARDDAYGGIIDALAPTDTAAAVAMLQAIGDEWRRGQAALSIATAFARTDLQGATRWADGLATGPIRDAALAGVLSESSIVGDQQLELANTIQDSDMRTRIKLVLAVKVARSDAARGQRLLEDPDIPESLRARVRAQMPQFSGEQ